MAKDRRSRDQKRSDKLAKKRRKSQKIESLAYMGDKFKRLFFGWNHKIKIRHIKIIDKRIIPGPKSATFSANLYFFAVPHDLDLIFFKIRFCSKKLSKINRSGDNIFIISNTLSSGSVCETGAHILLDKTQLIEAAYRLKDF